MPLPTEGEVQEYAVYLGLHEVDDTALFYLASWALTARLPLGWSSHFTADGAEYFHCSAAGVSTFEHPCDEMFRIYAQALKDGTARGPL
jgi:centrosomal protein CEP164